MKRALLLIAMLLLASPAYATDVTATFGDKNSSGEYRMKADTDGVVTYASDTAIMLPYEHYTSANTANALALTECGKTIVDMGGAAGPTALGAGSKHTLPRATPGCEFTFIVGSKSTITVDTVDASDTILYSISGTGLDAGDSIKSTGQAGDAVTVFSTVANKWGIKTMKAVWTDNGGS